MAMDYLQAARANSIYVFEHEKAGRRTRKHCTSAGKTFTRLIEITLRVHAVTVSPCQPCREQTSVFKSSVRRITDERGSWVPFPCTGRSTA
jgi:hypothetical protein